MLKLLRKRWWKYTCVVLLLYGIIGGLSTPLSIGITDVTPTNIAAGTTATLTLTGYNTEFQSKTAVDKLTLVNKENSICSSSVKVLDSRRLKATFDIPAGLKSKTSSNLYDVIGKTADGQLVFLANAVVMHADSTGTDMVNCSFDVKDSYTGFSFPYREVLHETIRNLFFHVPMWFTMVMLLFFSFISSLVYLNSGKHLHDVFASQSALVGTYFGFLGIITGMTWATFTWGSPWPNDPKLNGAAVGMLTYLAYFVLRGSLNDETVRARVSAVYNIFAFVLYIVFIFVIPRITDTLHPGQGGNPAFSSYDLDNTLRPVFYSSAAGFIILGHWIMSIRVRYVLAKEAIEDQTPLL